MHSIGRYRLVARIGAGSFATVWLSHDDDLDVPVAVKVLADNWASNPDVRNRFLAEARIMRRIHDRRLVQVYDIGTLDDGRPYFVMDYIDGGSLEDLRKQGIDPVSALRLCAEACRALDVLHAHDIIHRDVTPGNLLLSRTGRPAGLSADRRSRRRKVHVGRGGRHHDGWHTLLHGAGAGDGPDAARQSSRHLFAGRGDIRHVDQPSTVSGTQHCRHCRA
jgi:serine/threonine protein kinase